MAELTAVNDATFAQAVERASGLSVVDFGAEWCPPCRLITPILESLAAEYRPRVQVMSLDVDTSPLTAARFGVRNLPTVLFFRDGVVVDRIVGAVPRTAFQRKLDELLT